MLLLRGNVQRGKPVPVVRHDPSLLLSVESSMLGYGGLLEALDAK